MRKLIRNILIALTILILGLAFYYKDSLLPSVTDKADNEYLLIYKGTDLQDLADTLEAYGFVKRGNNVIRTAKVMGFSEKHIEPGRYKLKSGWNIIQLLDFLSKGKQTPLKFVLNPLRKVENVAAFAGKNFEMDSAEVMALFTDKAYLDSLGVDSLNAMTMFIPNTYEIYWTISPKAFIGRMQKESTKFWSQEGRTDKAAKLNMTTQQIYTLASIVDKETSQNDEKATIAGLYLNRIAQEMPLQADPTVVFAVGDFGIKRVTNNHTAIQSPFNTYLNTGLPPGPIGMATIAGIDAVLNHETHSYIYMCAKPDYSGRHNFAETFQAHVQNANIYRQWLDQQGF